MVDRLKFQHQRKCLQRITFFLSKEACLTHLVEHGITTPAGTFVKTTGVIERRVLTHTYQGSGFFYFQVLRVFGKIRLSRCLDTYGIVQEVELIKIHGKNFLLCIIAFQFYRNHPLNRFLQQTLHYIVGCR